MDTLSMQANDFLLRELLGVASGTWATLINATDYVTIDATRDRIVEFYLNTKANEAYETWQDVWLNFQKVERMYPLGYTVPAGWDWKFGWTDDLFQAGFTHILSKITSRPQVLESIENNVPYIGLKRIVAK